MVGGETPSRCASGSSCVLDTMGAMDSRDLYGLPLERFTQERNALAKQLRSERRGEEAAKVAALRKPTVEAWAVNQLVRTQRSELDALLHAGDRLAQAQADLLAGRSDPRALRDAVDAERTAVAALTERARGLLSLQGRGLTGAALEHVSETLHAAALDEDARAQVRDGCLNVGLRHIGLGTVSAAATSRPARRTPTPRRPLPSPADKGPGAKRGREPRAAQREAEQREAAKREAARAAARRAAALKAARHQETGSRRQLERATAELQAAEAGRDRAATALADAEAALTEARERAQRAADDHRRARAALDHL
jgi:hypothetical protein